AAKSARRRQACRRPAADDGSLALRQARGRDFELDGGDVGIHQRVDGRELRRRIELGGRVLDVDQVEGLAEVDDEGVATLAGEDASDAAAARDLNIPTVVVRIRQIVRDRLLADVIDRL